MGDAPDPPVKRDQRRNPYGAFEFAILQHPFGLIAARGLLLRVHTDSFSTLDNSVFLHVRFVKVNYRDSFL